MVQQADLLCNSEQWIATVPNQFSSTSLCTRVVKFTTRSWNTALGSQVFKWIFWECAVTIVTIFAEKKRGAFIRPPKTNSWDLQPTWNQLGLYMFIWPDGQISSLYASIIFIIYIYIQFKKYYLKNEWVNFRIVKKQVSVPLKNVWSENPRDLICRRAGERHSIWNEKKPHQNRRQQFSDSKKDPYNKTKSVTLILGTILGKRATST